MSSEKYIVLPPFASMDAMPDIQNILAVALKAHRDGRVPEAEELYRRILDEASDHVDALYLLGILLRQTERSQEALSFLRRATIILPESAEILFHIAQITLDKGNLEQSVSILRRSIALKPDLTGAAASLGGALQRLGLRTEAAACFEAAVKHAPRNAGLWRSLSTIRLELGQLQEATAALKVALEINPDDPNALSMLMNISFRRADWQGAYDACKSLVRHYPNHGPLHKSFGHACNKIKNMNEAYLAFRKAFQIMPEDKDSLYNSGYNAIYAGNFEGLKELLGLPEAQQYKELICYFEGISQFQNGDLKYVDSFRRSVEIVDATREDSRTQLSRSHPAYEEAFNVRGDSFVANLEQSPQENFMLPTIHFLTGMNAVKDLMIPEEDNVCVVLVSCDAKFFLGLSDNFMKEFRRSNKNLVHFHISPPFTEDVMQHLSTIRQRYGKVACSLEEIPPRSKTYHTLSRYIISIPLMEFYQKSIFVLDIDFNLFDNLDSMLSRADGIEECDVGFYTHDFALPWVQMAAGAAFLRNTVRCQQYLRLLSRYMIEVYNEGGFWTLDQTAMYIVLDYMNRHGSPVKVCPINSIFDVDKYQDLSEEVKVAKIKAKFDGGPI